MSAVVKKKSEPPPYKPKAFCAVCRKPIYGTDNNDPMMATCEHFLSVLEQMKETEEKQEPKSIIGWIAESLRMVYASQRAGNV